MEALRERIDKERETLVKQFKAAQQEDARIIEQRMQSQLEQEKAALLRIQSEKEAAWEREKAILLADQEERRRASLTMAQALKDTNRDFVLRNIDSARKVDMTRTFAAWRQVCEHYAVYFQFNFCIWLVSLLLDLFHYLLFYHIVCVYSLHVTL